ncbi:hypothetical protein JTB14_008448 [Gonioctena quinquepunctata]|nr:hypothetical protein JTB14_008448 [Gonioctena quinquepunctata]
MPNNKQTEKRRKQKRDCERRRRVTLKENPKLQEQAKIEERRRYRKRKEEGKLKQLKYPEGVQEPNSLESNEKADISKEIRHSIEHFHQKDENIRVASGKKDSITSQKI